MPEEIEIESLKKIAKGAGIVFVGLIISKFIIYFYRLFIARYFGPSDYGLFSLGLAVLGIVSIFALLGLPTGVTRYVSFYKAERDEQRVKGVITSSLKMVFVLSIFLASVLFLLSPFIASRVFNAPELTNVLRILSLAIPFSSLSAVLFSTFIGFKKVEYQVYTESIFSNLTKVIAVVIFGLLGFGVVGIALSWTVALILTFFLAIYFLDKKVYPIFKTPIKSISLKRELLSYSLPLSLASFLWVIIGWTDTLMIGYFMTSTDVGIYNVALPTSQLLRLFPFALLALFLPIMTELYSEKKITEMERLYKTVTRWAFYINFPIFLLFIFFSKQILNVMFGSDYIIGWMALVILGTGYMVNSLGLIASQVVYAIKKTKPILYLSIVVAFFNIILNYLLIPVYGIIGAALATSFAIISSSIFVWIIVKYFININPFSVDLFKSLFAGILSIFFVHHLARLLFSTFPIYVIVPLFCLFITLYGFLLLAFKGMKEEDIEILKAIEEKSGVRIALLRKILKRFM